MKIFWNLAGVCHQVTLIKFYFNYLDFLILLNSENKIKETFLLRNRLFMMIRIIYNKITYYFINKIQLLFLIY